MERFFYQLKRVKMKEIIQVWKLLVAMICVPVYRLFHKGIWIICEDRNEARDNGYWFFKYVRKEHPEQECVYAISKKSPDIEKIKSIGDWVEYGSLKHWIMYLASAKKISSQKAGNPNAAIFYFLEVFGLLKDKRVFLQHGVIKDDLEWLHYDATKINRFICGAYPEYQYVNSKYGYPKGNVCYTGLCRFDGLHENIEGDRMILIMPTWREWIADNDYRLEDIEGTKVIPNTKFFKAWIDFITDKRIKEFSEKYDMKFIFFPHRNMQQYLQYFPKSNDYIEIAGANKYGVQELLKNASIMVTDYSSVFFDMLYMKKPVVYYQFDYERFRKSQYREGYFHYDNNPFGKSYFDKDGVFLAIEEYIKNNFTVEKEYLDAHKEYFKLFDSLNCQRVYDVVNSL